MKLPKPVSEYYQLTGLQALLVDSAVETFRDYVPDETPVKGLILTSGAPRSETIQNTK